MGEGRRPLTPPVPSASTTQNGLARAAVRREDGVTIFWYAFRVSELLQVFSRLAPGRTVLESLNLHEYTSTRAIQAEELPSSDPQLQVVLHGHDLLGVKEPERRSDNLDFERTLRGGVETAEPAAPSVPTAHGTEGAAGVTVQGFPFLDAPQKVTVGAPFELEICLSNAPVVGPQCLCPFR